MKKIRLDLLIGQRFPDMSRALIQSLIMQAKVKVKKDIITKSGILVNEDVEIEVDSSTSKYVSRAGFKLESALLHFNINLTDKIALDSGLSTGGFTDCMLQNGIKHVYGVDVGYGQVHEKIRSDNRVTVQERINLRYLEFEKESIDIVTLDLSFISVLKVMSVVFDVLKQSGELIVLIKPQFEVEKKEASRFKGIIKDDIIHQRVVNEITQGIISFGFDFKSVIESPIYGTDGNKEFLAYFKKK